MDAGEAGRKEPVESAGGVRPHGAEGEPPAPPGSRPGAPASHRSACCAGSLAFGIAGIVLAGMPAVGRYLALGFGALALGLGAIGMRCAAYGVKGSGHRLAVAGLALGAASLFEGATSMLACFVVGSVLLGGAGG